MATCSKGIWANEPVDLIPMPAALLACRLRSRLGCQKQVGIGHWGRSAMKTTPLLLLVCVLAITAIAWSQENVTAPSQVLLPPCPRECNVALYGPIPINSVLRDSLKKTGSWKRFLEANGITFPNGGYAIYNERTTTLIVATTLEMQDLVKSFFTPIE